MLPSQLTSAAMPDVLVSPWVRTACLNSCPPASSRPAIAQTTTMTAVTSGPAIAILNSVPGVSESFSSRAKPPNIHRVIAETPMLCRLATKAWPSSCSRMEAKKRTALATAST